jgi:hypothetical protein
MILASGLQWSGAAAFGGSGGVVRAVDDISFAVESGQTPTHDSRGFGATHPVAPSDTAEG